MITSAIRSLLKEVT